MRYQLTPKTIFLTIGLLLALILPLLFGKNQYTTLLATNVLLYATLGTAWNIIGGMGGQFDLSAGAYLGIGSFVVGTLLIRFGFSPWITMFLGALIAVGLSLMVGLPLFRFKVREVWYALASAALVEVLRVLFIMWEEVGGATERFLPMYYDDFSKFTHMRFSSYVPYYYILLAMLIFAYLVNVRIRKTRLGYSLLALSEEEDAAAVLGVNVRLSKIKALMTYAFIVGLVGGVDVCIKGNLHASSFNAVQSTEVAILGIVGGIGITHGPLLAALFMVSIRELLRAQLGGGMEGLYMVIYAVVLILIAIFRPDGIAGILESIYNRIKPKISEENNGRLSDA